MDAHDQLRADDLGLRVEEVRALRRRAGVVERELPAAHPERAADHERLLVELDPALRAVLAPRQLADPGLQHPGRAATDRRERRPEDGRADLVLELAHLLGADVRAGDEALEIHLHHVALADVVEEQPPDVVDRLPPGEEPHRRHAHALLEAVAGRGREAPRHHAAHVDHVPRRARPADARAATEDRTHDDDVLQMEAAPIVRVVGEEDVAGRDRLAEAREDGRDRPGAHAEVERHGRGGGDDAAGGVVQDAGEVARLADERRHGGLDDRAGHLARQVLEAVPDDLDRDRVERFTHGPPRSRGFPTRPPRHRRPAERGWSCRTARSAPDR